MPIISLTDFVDFAIKSGTPKLTKVRTIKGRPDYEPAFDYWKQLREGICDFHRAGAKNKADLNELVESLQNPRKVGRYSAALKGYKRFLGASETRWLNPPSGKWSFEDLTVRVNPELGLRIDTDRFLIKLYFKDEAPTKNRVQIVMEMMNAVLGNQVKDGTEMAVLDVSKGKLILQTAPIPGLSALLEGEAAAFLQMWKALP